MYFFRIICLAILPHGNKNLLHNLTGNFLIAGYKESRSINRPIEPPEYDIEGSGIP
jgi:hypothetical protein